MESYVELTFQSFDLRLLKTLKEHDFMSTSSKPIIGIDLGTTFSAVAYVTEDGRPEIIHDSQNERITPSVVFFNEGAVFVGKTAKEDSHAFPDKVVSLVKRKMGTPEKVKADGQEYTPEQISAYILKKLKEDAESELGGTISDVVITVPAYFGGAERKATEDAGKIAGLNVRHIINEPTAAAIAFGKANASDPLTLLVYDLGGGTFDITILKIKPTGRAIPDIEVISSGGDRRLGGADWDQAMLNHAIKVFREEHKIDPSGDAELRQDLLLKCERAKIALTKMTTSTVTFTFDGKTQKIPFDRALLLELTRPLLTRTMDLVETLLEEKQINDNKIDEVLLVGGSTKLVMVREALEAKFGKERINNSSVNPDLCVAEGAALYAHLLSQSEGASRNSDMNADGGLSSEVANFIDVCPFALGSRVKNGFTDSNGTERPGIVTIISKDTKLPCEEMAMFRTVEAGQTSVEFGVYENHSRKKGEAIELDSSRMIATYLLEGLPAGRPASQPLKVTYRLDAAFRLRVTGLDVNSGKSVEAEIDYASALSKQDREKATNEVASADVKF
jgi:molecular chaperone DnaK